jgi:hypothetical protein
VATVTSEQEAITERTCRRCGGSRFNAANECIDCASRRKRRWERRRALGDIEIDAGPDNRPAIRMRLLLERDRRDCPRLTFDDAFDSNLELAVAGLPALERDDWLAALRAMRPHWRAGYERSSNVGSLAPSLLD